MHAGVVGGSHVQHPGVLLVADHETVSILPLHESEWLPTVVSSIPVLVDQAGHHL